MSITPPKTSCEAVIADFGLKKAAARVAKFTAKPLNLPKFFAKPMPQLTKAPRRKMSKP